MQGARAGHVAPDWESPGVLGINKRSSHAPLRSFLPTSSAVHPPPPPHLAVTTSIAPALRLQGLRSLPPEGAGSLQWRLRKLSGCEWAFKVFQNPQEVPADFFQPAYEGSGTADAPWGKVSSRPP